MAERFVTPLVDVLHLGHAHDAEHDHVLVVLGDHHVLDVLIATVA